MNTNECQLRTNFYSRSFHHRGEQNKFGEMGEAFTRRESFVF